MKRLFIETDYFKALLDEINEPGLEKDLKDEILKSPSTGDIVPGTGGIRKIRIPKTGRKGKSGGYRVLYLDLPLVEVVYLFMIYDKSVKENISVQQRMAIKKAIGGIKNEWKKSD